MSTQGKWREDQILVICPGSRTTLAQLGCGELTPPAQNNRFPTRMFKDDESDGWRPYHTFKRRKDGAATNGTAADEGSGAKADEDDWEYVEDQDSDEGAVYPLQAGRIVNMDAFLAFLDHLHNTLTTSHHNTPIILMASPQWTRPDCETITRYIFEKTKTPALSLMHSGVATQYGLKWPNMTVVDIGYEKVDVTCIYDSRVVSHKDVGGYPDGPREISGGEVFTRKLMKLLEGKGFNHDMAEQLKMSPVCEVLPYAPESPSLMELPAETGPGALPSAATLAANAAAAAATAAAAAAAAAALAEPPKIIEPVLDDDGTAVDDVVDEEGVLNIANIVTSGQTREFLAKKEKEKAEKGKPGRKPKAQEVIDPVAARARLPNSKRTWNVFHFEELITEDVPVAPPTPAKQPEAKDVEMADAAPTDQATAAAAATAAAPPTEGATNPPTGDEPKTEPTTETKPPTEGEAPKPEETAPPTSESAPTEPPAATDPAVAPQPSATEKQIKRVRRDIEVGLERFLFADRVEIDRIVTAIYQAVQGIEDMYMRPPCWENLVFVGNGARIRGLKDNIMQTLQARHLISPSTATMFTSELPSNIGTPSGTGAQTPTGSFTGQLPTTSSVNPLLAAATTSGMGLPGGPNAPGSNAGDNAGGPSHHFHSQTPTNIKLAALPTYLSEWTKNGFEEAMFLGAQVGARLAFCIHNLDQAGTEAQRLMSLSRVDYNEFGPKGIRSHSMLA